jgi:hypothetical protein
MTANENSTCLRLNNFGALDDRACSTKFKVICEFEANGMKYTEHAFKTG